MSHKKTKAFIALEDGTIFEGYSIGASGETNGELVFNTSLMGYQEILTDPSYKGQIVAMTYPLIGNYGINPEDIESRRPFVEGFVVRQASRIASNWRSKKTLNEYLNENGIVGIEGVDTRAITRRIRLQGSMKAVISSEDLNEDSLIEKAKASDTIVGRDLVREVAESGVVEWSKEGRYNVAVLDCGVKYNILRSLAEKDCRVKVFPASASAEAILSEKADGVLLSNGPGDPEGAPYVVDTVRGLLGKVPLFGICLGNQMLGLAMGGRTYKLKFGHHGGNHPVKDLRTGKVSISVQNHNFCVDVDSLDKDNIEITHINLNDKTLEGIKHRKMPVFSVQFHPECSPGPHDTEYLFDEFIGMMENHNA